MQEETNAHLLWDCFPGQEHWLKMQIFLKNNNLETDLTYYRISFSTLDKTI